MPEKLISNYIRDKLLFEKKRNEENLQGELLKDNEVYSNLKKRKTDVLNKSHLNGELDILFRVYRRE